MTSALLRENLLTVAYTVSPELEPPTPPKPPRIAHAFEANWRSWMAHVFPQFVQFADHHVAFWEWVWSIQPNVKPVPFVGIWPRGGAKSSSAEIAVVALLAREVRTYCLYASGTQPQAAKHLKSIAALLTSSGVSRYYPKLAERAVNKYGHSQGWGKSAIATSAGGVIDAIGLYTGTRGVRWEEQRPDLIVLDDVDELPDAANPERTEKKIETLTKSLLPAGSNDVATLAIQNLIIPDGVFARLAPKSHNPADFLADRIVSGPIPALYDLEYEVRDGRPYITNGRPSWDGQDLDTCQSQMTEWGVGAFIAEAQHEPRKRGDKIYQPVWWSTPATRYNWHDVGLLGRTVARYQAWDTASVVSATSAYSAVVVADLVQYRGSHALLIREVRRGKMEFFKLLEAIRAMATRYEMDNPPRGVLTQRISVEMASSGIQIVQAIKGNTSDKWLADMLEPIKPVGSKDDRSLQAAVYCMNGRVWLPYNDGTPETEWVGVFEQELFDVPGSNYRDMTDAFSQVIHSARYLLKEPLTLVKV